MSGLLDRIKELADMLYIGDAQSNSKLRELLPTINEYMMSFIEKIPSYNAKGSNIPLDVVVMQVNNMIEAIDNKDDLMLADCLMYEISESLKVYKEESL